MNMPPDRLTAFAHVVNSDRRQRDISRVAYCRLVGITRTTLRAIERASHQPTQATIDKFTRALHLNPDTLTGLTHLPSDGLVTELRLEDVELAHRFHHASAEVKYALKRFFSEDVPEERRERLARVIKALLSIEQYIAALPPAPVPRPCPAVDDDTNIPYT